MVHKHHVFEHSRLSACGYSVCRLHTRRSICGKHTCIKVHCARPGASHNSNSWHSQNTVLHAARHRSGTIGSCALGCANSS